MNTFGKHLIVKKQLSPIHEKEIFCEIIDLYEDVALRGIDLTRNTGINLDGYNEDFYLIIENLIYVKYGEWKSEIITWYIWERKDIITGEIGIMEITNEDTDKTREVIVKCSEDLWDVLDELSKKKNKDE